MDKNQAFEYYVVKLLEWYYEIAGNNGNNDLSTLKVLKLLFFGSAISAEETGIDTLLDGPFNTFYAMPYGHVESEIYDSIRRKEFHNLTINNSSSNIDLTLIFPEGEIKNQINVAIQKLKEANSKLILMTPFELVELSHRWYSWQFYFNKAQRNGSYSELIPAQMIKLEQKFFSL
ncbi:hypothetical protein [Flavobacterium sp. CLA17]|uniref:hypothetical protein n=1 Tax=Flavobacterium sp. CLA17 TaxID=2724135 RepID=UPI0014925BB7|nr:hypothetical protein [Flavobacterium sp. CLA17]QSB27685.1 hypothetical protein HAV12_002760 [Flavobacterium sp. CLA17]